MRTSSLHVAQVAAIGHSVIYDRLAAPRTEVKYMIRRSQHRSDLCEKYDSAIDMAEAAEVGLRIETVHQFFVRRHGVSIGAGHDRYCSLSEMLASCVRRQIAMLMPSVPQCYEWLH
jgi:hypothetical protein